MIDAKIMGILNITPDSFYDGSLYYKHQDAIAHGIKLFNQGADLLDIGGESSRPGATPVSLKEELERVIPAIETLARRISIPISIDTYKPEVALEAILAGAKMINDISGFCDLSMREIAASREVDICVMHMQGLPGNMQINPQYPQGVVDHLLTWFKERTKELIDFGVKREQITIDPGIGFGKTVVQNIEIIQNLPKFKALGFPLLMGISRKSFMTKITSSEKEKLLAPTIALHTWMMKHVDIIRVHDVAEHYSAREVLRSLTPCALGA